MASRISRTSSSYSARSSSWLLFRIIFAKDLERGTTRISYVRRCNFPEMLETACDILEKAIAAVVINEPSSLEQYRLLHCVELHRPYFAFSALNSASVM